MDFLLYNKIENIGRIVLGILGVDEFPTKSAIISVQHSIIIIIILSQNIVIYKWKYLLHCIEVADTYKSFHIDCPQYGRECQ